MRLGLIERKRTRGAGEPTAARVSSAARWLTPYMNDQLAAGVLWWEVARRTAREL
ncbi:MAG: hypothetical protein JO058_22355 [Alphaproteobacteria bacterium]|nr:hypothetical protein [Alphaproteobacteria bacterium]